LNGNNLFQQFYCDLDQSFFKILEISASVNFLEFLYINGPVGVSQYEDKKENSFIKFCSTENDGCLIDPEIRKKLC
jgi:hypothetical protein